MPEASSTTSNAARHEKRPTNPIQNYEMEHLARFSHQVSSRGSQSVGPARRATEAPAGNLGKLLRTATEHNEAGVSDCGP